MNNKVNNERSKRYNLPSIHGQFEGVDCNIVDISATGLLLEGIVTDHIRGDAITVSLRFPLMDKTMLMDMDGFIIRCDENGIAIDYVKPSRTWIRILEILSLREAK
jgi:hypothetical protein